MQALNVHQAHLASQYQQVKPVALHGEFVGMAYGSQIWDGIATQSQPLCHKAGMGEVDAVIVIDGDFAGKHLLQQRLHGAIAVGPIFIPQRKTYGGQHNDDKACGGNPALGHGAHLPPSRCPGFGCVYCHGAAAFFLIS